MKIPFSPSVYEHAAALIGRTPWEVSRDAELLFAAHRAAYREYRHTPIVVGIDIYNLEAEAYGGRVVEPGGNGIPAIAEPLVASLDEGRRLRPFDPRRDGRIPMVIGVASRLARELPEADVRIPVSGPFSIAVSLRGITGLLEDVALQPERVRQWLLQLAENQAAFCEAVAEAGLDVAFFESAAAPPLLSPRQFREVELPALKRAMAIAAGIVGHAVPCVIGGDTEPILDDILATGTGYVICPAETDQAAFVARSASAPHVKVRINLDPRTVAHGDRATILREVDRILALAATRPNCLLGTGALPYETPRANVKLIRDYVA
ncbi:MAG TPA: uroporphyrinogen decarboxylase family protein [Planctomycetota bacterium]|nr:uroporphyrinogen decarboxylase family protein [Planctomycetota bacterium]